MAPRESPDGPALVLLSGGIDSAVALAHAATEDWDPVAITFDYHDRPEAERVATDRLARRYTHEPPLCVPLPWLREAQDLPRLPARLIDAPEGYVPGRNLVYYAIACHYAEVLDASRIVGGHIRPDADAFPDASAAFFDAFDAAAARGLLTARARPVEFVMPLATLTKREVVEKGLRLGVPFQETWSCYWADRARPCGTCGSCSERADAFAALGRPDPLLA